MQRIFIWCLFFVKWAFFLISVWMKVVIMLMQSQEKTCQTDKKVNAERAPGSWESWSFFAFCWNRRINLLLIQRFRENSWKYFWNVYIAGSHFYCILFWFNWMHFLFPHISLKIVCFCFDIRILRLWHQIF